MKWNGYHIWRDTAFNVRLIKWSHIYCVNDNTLFGFDQQGHGKMQNLWNIFFQMLQGVRVKIIIAYILYIRQVLDIYVFLFWFMNETKERCFEICYSLCSTYKASWTSVRDLMTNLEWEKHVKLLLNHMRGKSIQSVQT